MSAFDKAWSFAKMTRFAPSEEKFNLHGESERLQQLSDLLADDPAINMRPRDEVGMERVGPRGGQYEVGNRWSRVITDRSLSPETLKRIRAKYGTADTRRLDEEKDSPTRGAMQYLFAPKRRSGEGESGSPLDRFETPEDSWHGKGTSHTVPERTPITPEHRERMLNTPQTEEEERAMDLFDTSVESGGISRGYHPTWEKMRIAGDIDYAKNIFDVIHHWNPKWGRPPDLHPDASEEELTEYFAAAAKLKEDYMDEYGFIPEKPSWEEIIEQENNLSGRWDELINEHGFLPGTHGEHSNHPQAVEHTRIREEMGHHAGNWGTAEKNWRHKMKEMKVSHAFVRPIQLHVAEAFRDENYNNFMGTEKGQKHLREKLLLEGDLGHWEWPHLQEHPDLTEHGLGPGELPEEIKQNLPILKPVLPTLQPDWEKTFSGIPESPGDVPRAMSVIPELNPVSRMFTQEDEDNIQMSKPMDLAWRLLKMNNRQFASKRRNEEKRLRAIQEAEILGQQEDEEAQRLHEEQKKIEAEEEAAKRYEAEALAAAQAAMADYQE